MEKRIRHRLELQRVEEEQKQYKEMRREQEKQEEEAFKRQVRHTRETRGEGHSDLKTTEGPLLPSQIAFSRESSAV